MNPEIKLNPFKFQSTADPRSLDWFAKIAAKIDEVKSAIGGLKVNLPNIYRVEGEVKVSGVDQLPPVEVRNLSEIRPYFEVLDRGLSSLEKATVRALGELKPAADTGPELVEVTSPISVKSFPDLLDGVEELKKGFNLLLNKDFGTITTPEIQKVELTNQMVPQPVTKVALRGGGTTDQEVTARTLTNAIALNVSVVDGSGNQITSFSGGGGSGGNVNITQVGSTNFSLGQQLAALSLPVVLTASQISTLTPLPTVATTHTDTAPATQNITAQDIASTSTTSANSQSLVTGSPTANSAASFSLSGQDTVRVQVTGTWTGTLTSEISIDGGTTWIALGLHQGAYTTSTWTANFVGGGSVAGATNYRIRATATWTGTATVKVVESINPNSVYIANAAPSGNVISTLNSSSATLLSGAVFTGTGEDVSNFSEMRISVISNVASASDGISIQQSTDNTNWDITDVYTVAAATGKTIVVPRQARYFRIVYTNGGTNQTSFRLQSILNRTATAPSSQRASDGYTNETDLVQNQNFNMLYNGATWDRMRSIATGFQGVGITNGTQTTDTLAGDSGQNALLTAGTRKEVTFSTTIVANVASTDVSNYRSVSVHQTSTGGSSTTTFQGSNDNTNWVSVALAQPSNTLSSPAISTTGTGIFSGPIAFRYFRLSITGIASGTTAGTVEFFSHANPTVVTMAGQISLNGTSAVSVSSQVPGVGATNLGKAEDAAHASGDTGIAAWGVRNDNLATTYGADQDYSPLATDLNGRVMVAQKASTATLSNVSTSGTTATLLAANSARIGATITNDAATALYIKFGTTASTTSYTVVLAGAASAPFSYYEIPAGYTGRIDGILASSTGTARVTEIS